MSHRDTDQPRVDRDLLDQLVRENGLTPYYINDAERQDREAAREWLNENVFDWDLPEHEIQLASEGSGGGGYWDGSMPVRIHTFDGECNGCALTQPPPRRERSVSPKRRVFVYDSSSEDGVAQRAHNLSPVPFGAAKSDERTAYHCSACASQSQRGW